MSRPALNSRRSSVVSSGDVVAGVSVALILIPQALAYAGIAGVPPHVGLFAAALPTIVAAPFASSRYLQTGPVAMTALLTFGALSSLATPYGTRYVALAALLAVVVGLIRIVVGVTGLGWIAHFMSKPVMIGFTIGATALIAASQLPALLGVGRDGNDLLVEAWRAVTEPSAWNWGAVLFGAGAVIVIELGRRVGPRFPGVLIAVAVATIVSVVMKYEGAIVGDIPLGLPDLSLDLPWAETWHLLVPGLVIALVGFTEAAAISGLFAAQDREPWNAGKEFISQGAANLASGLSGGFPVGGSFSRSSVNRLAGAQSRWSGAITGLAVLAFLPFASVVEALPSAVLAAIVITAVGRLIKPQQILQIWRQSQLQGVVAAVTLAATLVLAPRIDLAVLIGVGLAIVVHLGRELRLDVEASVSENVLTISPSGVIFFGSTPGLVDTLMEELTEHPEIDRLVIDLGGVGRIDFTGGNALSTIIANSKAADVEVEIINTPPHAQRIVNGVLRDLGAK